MIIKNPIHISEEMAIEIIAFTKMHEREEIPDEMWDVVMYLQEEVDSLPNLIDLARALFSQDVRGEEE